MATPEQTSTQLAASATGADCGCATGLKKPAAWQGFVPASVLPAPDFIAADAAAEPEPETAQGAYNAQVHEAPLSVPLVDGQAAAHPVELLAPAGGLDAGYAAFHYGADAIYLGLKKFSARAEAENFTLDDVDHITAFAHSLTPRRKVFVTINTLVLQHELKELVEALGALSDIGVDALIIQDLGTYRVVRQHFPNLELHASTQLAVHNRAGAEALKALGFTRVVLARELTLEEVRDITATAGVETEVFIHGALCYSYSGLCLFSSQTIGRSGNRGKCSYTCRDNFQITGAPETLRDGTGVKRDPHQGFAFSMKDLALPDHLPALRAAGVSCVKIEGRKKSPLYVATTTDYYRKILDGRLSPEQRIDEEAELKTVFSRPWTRLFMQSHRDKEVGDRDTVGHRGQPVGTVDEIVDEGSARPRLRFRAALPIERHDGLQIDLPVIGKPFGFAVETLSIVSPPRGRNGRETFEDVFEAPAEALLEVVLPEEHPPIPVGAPIYLSSSQAVKRKYRFQRPNPGLFRGRRSVDAALSIAKNCVRVRLAAGEVACEERISGSFEAAKDAARMEAAARGAFEKMGETRLSLGIFACENADGLFVPVSLLNELRREACHALERELDKTFAARIEAVERDVLPPDNPPAQDTGAARWSIKIDRIGFVDAFDAEDWREIDELAVDVARDHATILTQKLDALAAQIGRGRIRLALPAVTRKWEEKGLLLKIEKLRAAGWNKWEAANASAWSYLGLDPLSPAPQLDLATDWSVYVINRMAAQQALAMGATRFCLSPEDGLANMRSLLAEFGAKAVVIVHQDTPLFMAESCAYANLIGGCPGKANCKFESMDMVSSYGEKVTALDYHCRTIVLNKGAFCLSPWLQELRQAGAQSLRADFIYRRYEPADVQKAWRQLRAGKNVAAGHAANFERGLL
jgi:U32 family peptidase